MHWCILRKHITNPPPPLLSRIPSITTTTIVSVHKIVLSTLAIMATPMDQLRVKLLSEHATMPTRGSPQSAGFDLSASEACIIPAGGRGLVKTDISIACPVGTYARIAPRSGLAYKNGIDVGAGVVDADYRGPVGVILFNLGTQDFVITKGDRIAQLILEKVCMTDAVQVDDLDDTERGVAGFGSTGVQAKKQRIVSPTNKARNDDDGDKGVTAEQ